MGKLYSKTEKKGVEMFTTTIKDIKKMFAKEHATVVSSLFGTKYYDRHTGKKMSKKKALEILAGNY